MECDNRKCKKKKLEFLYQRTQYGGGPYESGWYCLECHEDRFGEYKIIKKDLDTEKEQELKAQVEE